MTGRERFNKLMNYEPFDRCPAWYFGTWTETLDRWLKEGLEDSAAIPEETGMDPDWERGMWDMHGLVDVSPRPKGRHEVLEETNDYKIVRTSLGAIIKQGKHGSSIPQHIEEALKPTRESWKEFKRLVDPTDASRRAKGWQEKAELLNESREPLCFLGGSLFASPREWMGVEAFSILAYDDPILYEEIIEHIAEYFMALNGPILEVAKFDFAYFFEDCCFNNGPLFSPDTYRKHFAKYYRRMVDFYHARGVPFVLLDSDGKTDDLIPCWLDSGIDILFPIEVGTWKSDPVELRKRFGKDLRMMGGVNKHIIPTGETAVRRELERLKPLVESGGYIPLPDHRIPPDCSFEAFRTYVQVFRGVLGVEQNAEMTATI